MSPSLSSCCRRRIKSVLKASNKIWEKRISVEAVAVVVVAVVAVVVAAVFVTEVLEIKLLLNLLCCDSKMLIPVRFFLKKIHFMIF